MTTLNPNATNKDYLDASAEIISEFAKRATGTTLVPIRTGTLA